METKGHSTQDPTRVCGQCRGGGAAVIKLVVTGVIKKAAVINLLCCNKDYSLLCCNKDYSLITLAWA